MLRENLATRFAKQCSRTLEVLLHLRGGDRLFGKQEHMSAAGLASADDKGQLKAANLLDQPSMIQRILVNINASPNAGVVRTNRDDAKRRLHAFKMLLPEVIGGRFANDNGFSSLFAAALLALNLIGPIGDI